MYNPSPYPPVPTSSDYNTPLPATYGGLRIDAASAFPLRRVLSMDVLRYQSAVAHGYTWNLLRGDQAVVRIADKTVLDDLTTNGSVANDWPRFVTLRDRLANQ